MILAYVALSIILNAKDENMKGVWDG